MKKQLHNILFSEINSSTLGLFRIVFGLLMFYQINYYINLDLTFQFISGPEFLFEYAWLPSLKSLPGSMLKVLLALLLVSTILITIGKLYRYAMVYFFIVFTLFSFADKSLYNNHLYLMSLMAFVMIFMDAKGRYALFGSSQKKNTVPAWNIRILQFLIVLVYLYGALSKINIDWFDGSIVAAILQGVAGGSTANIEENPMLVNFLVYGGFFFDLFIGFMLLYRPTRKIGFILVLIFNIMNANFLFNDIGVFPYFMIASTLLFVDPDHLSKVIGNFMPSSKISKKSKSKKLAVSQSEPAINQEWNSRKKVIAVSILLFVSFHLIWPFRYLIFTDNPEWTGHAARFSWRMKLQTKSVEAFELNLTDGPLGAAAQIDFPSFLSKNQLKHIVDEPVMVVQFAKYLHRKAIREGRAKDPVIKSNIVVSMNKRPAQLMINPEIDLTKVDESIWADYNWIVPLNPKN